MSETIAKKVIILARVSSDEQKDNYSLPAQIRLCQEYADRNNLEVLEIIPIVESSTKGTRKNFHIAIEKVRKYHKQYKEPIGIVVHKVDRLQRDFDVNMLLKEDIENGNVELHFASESLLINKESKQGEYMRWWINTIGASSYAKSLSENTKRGLMQKRKQGEFTSKAPMGYKNTVDENGKKNVVIDDVEGPVMKKIFEMYATGNYSIETIVDDMNKKGYRDKRGKPLRRATIWRAIQNPFYYGVMVIKGVSYQHKHDKLITKELFDLCQKVRLGYNKKHHNYGCKEFVFRGNLVCGECGGLISPYTKHRPRKDGSFRDHTYLSCSHFKHKANGTKCKQKQVKEDKILEEVAKALDKVSLDKRIVSLIAEDLEEEAKNSVKEALAKESATKKQLTILNNKRSSLFDAKAKGLIADEYFEKELQNIACEETSLKTALQRKSAKIKTAQEILVDLMRIIPKIGEIFRNCPKVDVKRSIMNLVLSNLTLKEKSVHFSYKKPFGLLSEGSNCLIWGTLIDYLYTFFSNNEIYWNVLLTRRGKVLRNGKRVASYNFMPVGAEG